MGSSDSDSAHALVARFLRTNNYPETLAAFVDEAALPPGTGDASQSAPTLESLLEEKRRFDQSQAFSKAPADRDAGWTLPAPSAASPAPLPSPANVLAVGPGPDGTLVASTAARVLHVLSVGAAGGAVSHVAETHPCDSPVLSWLPIDGGRAVLGAMSGQVVLWDARERRVLDQCDAHAKYVVRVASCVVDAPPGGVPVRLLASAAWDKTVCVREIAGSRLAAQLCRLALPTNPEDLAWHRDAASGRLFLVVARGGRAALLVYEWFHEARQLAPVREQSLSPHAGAWSGFAPACIAACPTDPGLLAVATSGVPFMRVVVVRLVVPDARPLGQTELQERGDAAALQPAPPEAGDGGDYAERAARARRLAVAEQERDTAAVVLHVSAQAPQTDYSTPRVAWRPDGSGLWVGSDDGRVRGIELSSGKVVATLGPEAPGSGSGGGGHEAGSKVRDVWAGLLGGEEVVVSGGFDRRVVVWRIKREG